LIPEDEDEDECFILTASHVLTQVPDGSNVLWAPPGPEPGNTDGSYCGRVRRRVPLDNLAEITADAAVIKPPAGLECCNQLACGSTNGTRDLSKVQEESEMIRVQKHGAQTLLTSGELLPIATTLRMEGVKTQYGDGWLVDGDDGASFATRDDSGAMVVDEDRRVVGMVVALEHPDPGASSFVHGIERIFSALQIELP
jgi:hypothetical protein